MTDKEIALELTKISVKIEDVMSLPESKGGKRPDRETINEIYISHYNAVK